MQDTKPSVKKITDFFSKQNLLMASLMFSLTAVSFLNLVLILYKPPQVVEAKTISITQKISFWTNFLSVHPTYFEGWVALSNLHISSKNMSEAKSAYQKAFAINPNSQELAILKIKLGL